MIVILIDWSYGGHNTTHLLAFANTLARCRCEVEFVVSPTLGPSLRSAGGCSEESTSIAITEVDWPGFVPIRPLFLQVRLRRIAFADRIASAVGAIKRCHPNVPCVLFFSCLFEQDFDLALRIADRTGLPWSFLYLHPYFFADRPTERFLNSATAGRLLNHRNLMGVATMNENVVQRVSGFSSKPVFAFPEITDHQVQRNHPLGNRFRDFARMRSLVVTAGYLGAWKGVGLLSRVCIAADADRFAFLFAGPMPLETFRPDDREAVERCLDGAPHALFHLARIPDGPPYNAILQSSDIIFAAFEDFPFSSNTLTKAALLRKPVIVSEGGLSAQRVREFNLGLVIPFGDVEAVLGAIESLGTEERRREFAMRARWDDYLALHGEERLEAAFRSLFGISGAGEPRSVSLPSLPDGFA
jgi:glycosyltransferase involved in cell wall biosynthesis